jgi:hypothetical protein
MVNISIQHFTREETEIPNGIGYWGVKLAEGESIAYECPMIGDGGASNDLSLLAALLSNYHCTETLDAADGPDEILYCVGDTCTLLTITIQ